MRGVRFENWHGQYLPAETSDHIAMVSLDDVSKWLGFVDPDDYLRTLPIERERIFDRAKD